MQWIFVYANNTHTHKQKLVVMRVMRRLAFDSLCGGVCGAGAGESGEEGKEAKGGGQDAFLHPIGKGAQGQWGRMSQDAEEREIMAYLAAVRNAASVDQSGREWRLGLSGDA
jgi:hypothetical protein